LILLSDHVKDGHIKALSDRDIKILFDLYDREFFHGAFNSYDGTFKFSLSKRMTKSAGMTLCPRTIRDLRPSEVVIEFRFGINFFFRYDLTEGNKFVSGIETHNA